MYKTTPILGTHAVFNQDLKFLPLTALDGYLLIDIREKPTFDDGFSVGKLKLLISSLSTSNSNNNRKELTESLTSEKGEKLILTYVAEVAEISNESG